MRIVKPSKQTLLKGLLLLVVGLNFSWRPLLTELHQTTMAESLPASTYTVKSIGNRQKSGAEIAGQKAIDPNDPFTKFDLICGKYMSLKLLPDGTHARRVFKDADNKVINCEQCDKEIYKIDDSGLLATNPNSMVDEVVSQLMPASCDALLTDKEKEEKIAKEKELEEAKHKLALDKASCMVDKNGKDISDDQQLNCQLRNMNLTDAQLKAEGIDKDEANKIRKDLAKDSLSSIASTCKKNHKEDDDFTECDDLMKRYHAGVTLLASHTKDKSLKTEVNALTAKYDKLDSFIDKEKKAVERVDHYKAEYEKLNNQMEAAHTALARRCDQAAVAFTARNQDFDTDACTAAYTKKYILPAFEPKLKILTTRFAAEERKFKADFQAAGKADIIGTEGAVNALAPFKEYSKELNNYGVAYNIPRKDLPTFEDGATSTANFADWTDADLKGRLGVGMDRQFTPLIASAAATGVAGSTLTSSLNRFPTPAGISRGVYNAQLPTANLRQSAVTSGIMFPQTQAGILLNLD